MREPERPADKIVRLMREASVEAAPTHQVIVKGDGNVLGDVININHPAARQPRRSDRRTLRTSAISFIRSSCRRAADPLLWRSFAIAEFGTADLEALTDLQLERVRGWCAAQEERRA